MANEKRLIDANFVYELHSNYPAFARSYADLTDLRDILDEAPTVDAVEVVHGRWEQIQRWATKAKYRCSVCGREVMSAVEVNIEKYPHCHCGAKMDGGKCDGLL